MAYSSKSTSFHKILIIVFGIAFGLLALMMVYQGVKTNLDSRSRAAQEAVEYKGWNFTSDAEGWTGTNVNSLNVSGGILYAVVGPGSILNAPADTVSLPQGNKYIKIRMAAAAGNPVLGDQTDQPGQANCAESSNGDFVCHANPNPASGTTLTPDQRANAITKDQIPGFVPGTAPVGGTQPCVPKPTCVPGQQCVEKMYAPLGGWCPTDATPNPTNPPAKRYITISVHYAGELLDAGLTVNIPVDASMNDYTLQFPEVNDLSLNQLSVHVDSGSVRPDTLLIDSISLVGPVVSGGTTACTQEAKVCPDGTTVGRTGPNCDFAPCGQTIQPQPDQQQNVQYQNINRGDIQQIPTNVVPKSTITWDECTNTPGSVMLQTYPPICKTPDGRTVTQTINTTPVPTNGTEITITPPAPGGAGDLTWDSCANAPGSVILQTNPPICRTQDGREVTEPTTSAPAPIIEWVNSVGDFFRGLFGFGQ